MQVSLMRALLARDIVRPSTEIEARYKGVDLSGSERYKFTGGFILRSHAERHGHLYLHCASTRDGRPYEIMAEDVLTIDGMDPERLAMIYNIRPDGEPMKAKARRGRKPKHPRPGLIVGF